MRRNRCSSGRGRQSRTHLRRTSSEPAVSRQRLRFFTGRSREDEPHLYNLVPWSFLPTFAAKSRKAVVLLEAVNRGALDSLAEDVKPEKTTRHRAPFFRRFIEGVNGALSPSLKPEKAKLVWTTEAIDHLRHAQRFFVPPV